MPSPNSSTRSSPTNRNNEKTAISNMPKDIQVNILTYLRAYDLAALQMTCKFYSRPELIEEVVSHFADNIYPSEYTCGFEASPPNLPSNNKVNSTLAQNKVAGSPKKHRYTFEDLRNMELLVVARALNSPEPATGFFVSKSWCKTALRWLEIQQEQTTQRPKKLSKKKQRLRDRKLSDASPPWPDANIDLLCEHHNLQRCSNGKSARARRRLLDRQAWKILKKLYPDSTQLESAIGECLQCTLEAETHKKNEADRLEQEKKQRKLPLANEEVRRFYTRRTGLPSQSIKTTASLGQCPLQDGNYYILPRSWCYAWRRYVKTGEGGQCPAPDASALLCHAHRIALIPPHLEAFLYGETPDLLYARGDCLPSDLVVSPGPAVAAPAAAAAPVLIPGQGPDPEFLEALRAVGIGSPAHVNQQLAWMRELEETQRPPVPPPPLAAGTSGSHVTKNELLDWENYSVVEILTEQEYKSLESCWSSAQGFRLSFGISEKGVRFHTTPPPCRECDATGRLHALHIKNRSRKALRQSVDKDRVTTSLEY